MFLSACSTDATEDKTSLPKSDYLLPYQLNKPDTVFNLPFELREISGLSMAPDSQSLVAVNDEEGVIFYLNPETGAVERTRAFGPFGDYEGIETVGTDIYVVKSSGTLYRVPENGNPETFFTTLGPDYDVEGLGYDATHHRLLLACKGIAGKADSFMNKKAIYAFNLSTHQFDNKPVCLIDRNEIARWKGGSPGLMEKIFAYLSTDNAAPTFGPSGVACNPADSMIYVIAASGKTLAVLHPDGRIAHAERLHASRFHQPEGICFDKRGRLFISSEGKKQAGRLLRFSPLR